MNVRRNHAGRVGPSEPSHDGELAGPRRILSPSWSLRGFRAFKAVPWLLVLALIVQGVELLLIGYLIDLALSLFDLWVELAQKHLEITL